MITATNDPAHGFRTAVEDVASCLADLIRLAGEFPDVHAVRLDVLESTGAYYVRLNRPSANVPLYLHSIQVAPPQE